MRFSFVISTRNRDDTLQYLIPSLLNQKYPKNNYEIIIVNYGGSHKTKRLINQYHSPLIKYYYVNQKGIFNESYSKNIGIKKTQGEIIICTNADLIYSPDLLSRFDQFYQATKGRYLYQLQRYDLNKNENLNQISQLIFKKSITPNFFQLQDKTACGDFQAASREKWFQVQGYDERMTGWGRMDLDLAERMSLIGSKQIWIDPQSLKLFHQFHPTKAPSKNLLNHELSQLKKNPIVNGPNWGRINKPQIIYLIFGHKLKPTQTKQCDTLSDTKRVFNLIQPSSFLGYDLNQVQYFQKSIQTALKNHADYIFEIDYPEKNIFKRFSQIVKLLNTYDAILSQPYSLSNLATFFAESNYVHGNYYNLRAYNARLAAILANKEFHSFHYFYPVEVFQYCHNQELNLKIINHKKHKYPINYPLLIFEILRDI